MSARNYILHSFKFEFYQILTNSKKELVAKKELVTASTLLGEQFSAQDAIEEHQRQHEVVIKGMPESTEQFATKRAEHDYKSVCTALDICNIQILPIATFRMGQERPNTSRLLKVRFPNRSSTRSFLRQSYQLADKPETRGWKVRASMSREELEKKWTLSKECSEKRQTTKMDYVVYAGQVMLRSDIKQQRNNPEAID